MALFTIQTILVEAEMHVALKPIRILYVPKISPGKFTRWAGLTEWEACNLSALLEELYLLKNYFSKSSVGLDSFKINNFLLISPLLYPTAF